METTKLTLEDSGNLEQIAITIQKIENIVKRIEKLIQKLIQKQNELHNNRRKL